MMTPPVAEVLALTGTPGTGKTTVANLLRKRGYTVFSLNELAERLECVIGEEEGCKIVDVEGLSKRLRDVLPRGFIVIVEGHLSHLLNPDRIIVLRCNPLELKRRLEKRGWPEEKVLENVEAEIVDVILVEAIGTGKDVHEIDTTNRDPEDVADMIEDVILGKRKFEPGKIDWISVVGEEIEELMRKI